MYLYKVRWYQDDSNSWTTTSGIVAGGTMVEALEKIREYFGETNVEDVRITALESGDGILDFAEFSDRVSYKTFFPEE